MNHKMSPAKYLLIICLSSAILLLGVLVIKAPTTVVLIASGLTTMCLAMIFGVKWDTIMDDILEFAKKMYPAILILIFVGMMVGSWMLSGTVPMMIYYGLKWISPSIFLVATTLICSIMCLMIGTSWGTMSTVGVALMGVSVGLGIPAPYTAGAIIVGALFGDKMSPMSDTTVLAASLSGVDLFDHIKYMLFTTVPGYLISLILFLVLGLRYNSGTVDSEVYYSILNTLEGTFNMNIFLMIPPIVVVFLIFRQKPILPVMAVGVILGGILAMIFQGTSLLDVTKAINAGPAHTTGVDIVDSIITRGGINSMMSSVSVIIAASLFGAPLKSSGVIEFLVECIQKVAKSSKSLMFFSYLFHMALMTIIGGYYTTFSIAGPILQPLFEKSGLHKKNLSRLLEDTGTTYSALVPWSSNGVYMAATLGVATVEYAPFIPLCYLGLIFAMIYNFTGFTIAKTDPVND